VIFDLDRPAERRALLPSDQDIHRLRAVKATYTADTELLKASGDPAAAAAIAGNEARVAAIERQIRVRHLLVAALVSLPVLLASWLSLFNAPFFLRLDDRLEVLFVRAMDWLVPAELSDRIVLVMADESDSSGDASLPMKRRCDHAEVINGLAAAKAAVLAIDLLFEQGFAECDPKLAAAIENARQSGTAVVIGVQHLEWVNRTPRPRIAESLRAAVGDGWGMVRAAPGERKLPLAWMPPPARSAVVEEAEIGVVPSFSLRVVMQIEAARRGTVQASYDAGDRAIRLRDRNRTLVASIPVLDRYLSTIVDVPDVTHMEGREQPYRQVLAGAAEPGSLAAFENSIVIVGYRRPGDLWDIGRDRPLYGAHLHASAVSNLLAGDYVRPLAVRWHYLLIVAMGGAAVLVRARVTRRRAPVVLLAILVVYAGGAIFLYWLDRIVLDFSYHVFALTFTYWLLGRLRSGLGARSV
jgi:CHASE2 domain-containing sensor protein